MAPDAVFYTASADAHPEQGHAGACRRHLQVCCPPPEAQTVSSHDSTDVITTYRLAVQDSGKPMVDAAFGELMVTCEKAVWLACRGEAALKPEHREPGIMVRCHSASRALRGAKAHDQRPRWCRRASEAFLCGCRCFTKSVGWNTSQWAS
jgi:hypothetical protein